MRRFVPVLLFAALACACFPIGDSVPSPTPGFDVDLDPSLTARLSPYDAGEIAYHRLHDMYVSAEVAGLSTGVYNKVLKVWSRRAADVHSVDPELPGMDGTDVVWVVRAEGTFYTDSKPKPAVWPTGYLLIDDSTGDIIGERSP